MSPRDPFIESLLPRRLSTVRTGESSSLDMCLVAGLIETLPARPTEGTDMNGKGPALDVVVQGGRVVTSTDVLDTAIGIRGDKIAAIAPPELLPKAERTIDATGKIVLPGAIDSHCHLGTGYDDWRGGPIAAAHAGLTTLLGFMLCDHTVKETLPQAIKKLRDETEQTSVLDF